MKFFPLIFVCSIATAQTFHTTFDGSEDPISESGAWVTNVANTPDGNTRVIKSSGIAKGTQTGSGGFDDSMCFLVQQFFDTVHLKAYVSSANSNGTHEVELVTHATVYPSNKWSGWETNFSASGNLHYISIVQIDSNQFTQDESAGSPPTIASGDSVEVIAYGTTIKAYWNGNLELTKTNATAYQGARSVGIGFFIDGTTVGGNNHGFTEFYASSTVNFTNRVVVH